MRRGGHHVYRRHLYLRRAPVSAVRDGRFDAAAISRRRCLEGEAASRLTMVEHGVPCRNNGSSLHIVRCSVCIGNDDSICSVLSVEYGRTTTGVQLVMH
jgi:hypothetical protein